MCAIKEQNTLPEIINKIVGNRIREQRKGVKKLTQNGLAMKLGINRSVVAKLEAGLQNITIQQLYQIGYILNEDPKAFLPDWKIDVSDDQEMHTNKSLGTISSTSEISLAEIDEIKKFI